MWVLYDGVKTPFMDQALRSSLAITGLPPLYVETIIDKVKESIRSRGGVIDRRALIDLVSDLLSPYGIADRYRTWEAYRELRRTGKYDKPIIILLSGASGTGKSVIASDLVGRFAITRIYSTDSIRQLVRLTNPKPTVMVHTWEAKDYLTEEDIQRLRETFGEQSLDIYGYLDQSLWVLEKGVKPLVERLNKEGANALLEGVHLIPGIIEGENIVSVVLEVPYEIHRAFVLVKARRSELKDIGRSEEEREQEFLSIRAVHDFLVSEARKRGTPVVTFTSYEETVKRIIDLICEKVKGIVEEYL